MSRRHADRYDWRNIFRPVQYTFDKSWHLGVVLALTVALSIIAFIQMATYIWCSPILLAWNNRLALAGVAAIVWDWIVFLLEFGRELLMTANGFLFILGGSLIVPYGLIADFPKAKDEIGQYCSLMAVVLPFSV